MNELRDVEAQFVPLDSLKAYDGNAKQHDSDNIDAIANSISEFGFRNPILAWHNEDGVPEIVAGHGRAAAAKKLRMEQVPVIFVDDLTDAQRRMLTLADNQTTLMTGWDDQTLQEELDALTDLFDIQDFGFDFDIEDVGWDGTALSTAGRESGEGYDEFTKKFEPKLTTDDCYTPDYVFKAVKDWACAKYGIDPDSCVRPFYPGGDYERYDYPDGCTVLDNPPFSILSKIIDFYEERGIPYFLFGPQLTLFNGNRPCKYICAGISVEYENGAKVNTGFITSYGDWKIDTAPDLHEIVETAQREAKNEVNGEPMNSWQLPDNVITAAMMGKLGKRGISLCIPDSACSFIRKLDNQKQGAALYGGGFLLSIKQQPIKQQPSMLSFRLENWKLLNHWKSLFQSGRSRRGQAVQDGRPPTKFGACPFHLI